MAIALKNNSFQRNLLFSICGVFLLFALCFSIYQYQREKDYKIDILHSRLQMLNYELFQSLGNDNLLSPRKFHHYLKRHNIAGLRVTIINLNGKVLLDSYDANINSLGNHLLRAEIQQAIINGNGYDIKRTSQSTHETYFYSATRFNNIIIRTAVPYSSELTQSLQADNTYLYFSILLTILLGFILYLITNRISRHIGYLREFAIKAEAGKELDHELERRLPDDELGDISHTIIQLYWKLRYSEEEKIRIKRQLTQNSAHELKTPAASIHGYLESIIENPNMPLNQQQHFIHRCYAQSERMCSLLHDMSVLTKLDERGKLAPALECPTIDVKNIISAAIDDTALQLKNQGINVLLNIPNSIIIHGDDNLIYSIFRNLIDNIIFHASGANVLRIDCDKTIINSQPYFQFVVSDNGTGVTSQHLVHLFERFYRVDKGRSRKLGGTGLGLAIVKNAVIAHGGSINAESTLGGGLTIKFTLSASEKHI